MPSPSASSGGAPSRGGGRGLRGELPQHPLARGRRKRTSPVARRVRPYGRTRSVECVLRRMRRPKEPRRLHPPHFPKRGISPARHLGPRTAECTEQTGRSQAGLTCFDFALPPSWMRSVEGSRSHRTAGGPTCPHVHRNPQGLVHTACRQVAQRVFRARRRPWPEQPRSPVSISGPLRVHCRVIPAYSSSRRSAVEGHENCSALATAPRARRSARTGSASMRHKASA